MAARGAYALALAVVVVAVVSPLAQASLDYSRVHLVDRSPEGSGFNNFLFRGNMPTNDTDKDHPTFAYDTLLSYMKERANEANVTFPDNVYLVDVSLNNPFDGADYWAEVNYWKDGAHAEQGQLVQWPLGLAGIIPPCVYPMSKRLEMANSSVWKVDKVPSRIRDLRAMLTHNFNDRPAAIYVHCSAGCDRTGEVIGSYILWYQTNNLTAMYAEDTTDCGRSPNYFSTSALEWFCYYYKDQRGEDSIGNCCDFATCKIFGNCKPTGQDVITDATAGPPSSAFHANVMAAGTKGMLSMQLMDSDHEERMEAFITAAAKALDMPVDD